MHTEPSLTLDTLSSVLNDVQNLDYVANWLRIPYSKQDELQQQYDRRQLPRAYSTVFLTEVPSPSWSIVALVLWETGEHGALKVVQKLYLKGELHTAVGVRGELVVHSFILLIKFKGARFNNKILHQDDLSRIPIPKIKENPETA
jgi:hypothetical protein